MKIVRLLSAVLLAGFLLAGCAGSGKKASDVFKSQTPEEFVREKYGLYYDSEEEYEKLNAEERKLWTYGELGQIPALAAAYEKEDAYFALQEQNYLQLYDNIERLVFVALNRHGQGEEGEKALLAMMEEGNYGNKEQCRVLIDAVKKDGFLRTELAQMREAHRQRLAGRIAEELGKLVGKHIPLPFTADVELPEGYIEEVCLVVSETRHSTGYPYDLKLEVVTRDTKAILSSFRVGEWSGKNLGYEPMEDGRGKKASHITWQQLAHFRPGATVDLQFYRGIR